MKKEWVNFKQLGQLYVEQVLVKMDIPIFFICVNDIMERYACLTIDDEIGQYIIKKVELNELIATLKDQNTLYDLFKNGHEKQLYLTEYDFDNQIMNDEIISTVDISDDYMPKKGEYFELVNDDIEKYINYLMSMKIQVKTGRYSEHNKKYTILKSKLNSHVNMVDTFNQNGIEAYQLNISKMGKQNIFFNMKDSNFVA